MRRPRFVARGRWIRWVSSAAIAVAPLPVGCAGAGRDRPLPCNAVQPPGASFEGEPHVGKAQAAHILGEIVGASLRERAEAPIRTTFQNARRLGERLAVRVREEGPTCPRCGHRGCRSGACGSHGIDLGGGAGEPTLPARLTLLPGSEPALRSLLDLIASARSRVDLMIYGWQDDPTGREVAAALADRARAGVRVRLLVDRTGFLIHNPAAARGECTFLDALRDEPNVTVIEPSGAFFRFDHRKLAVVDDRIAWTGGMILTEAARRRWHNLAFLAEGPVVASYGRLFEERWEEQGGCPSGPIATPAPIAPNAEVRLVRTDLDVRTLREAIYHAVDHARRSIYLENPYFSDEILVHKLAAARARGVDVRAILTLRGNLCLFNLYETLTANRLIRGGVRVYLYPAMTHVKALSADGVWAYIGTGNFDELSLRNNREVGLSVASPAVVEALDASLFEPDMAASQELTAPLPPPKGRLALEALSLWY